MKPPSPNKKRYERLRWPVLGPLSIALLALFAVFLTAANVLQDKRIHDDAAHNISAARKLYDYRIQRTADQLAAILITNAQDVHLLEKLAKRDKPGLLAMTSQLFSHLNAAYGITHYYFSDAQRINILRVHNPSMDGDMIDRFSTLEAERAGKLAWSVENGWFGSLTLRVVNPVYINGHLVGYMELGKEIDHLLPEIGQVIDVDMSVVIFKPFLHRDHWEDSVRKMGKTPDWDEFSDVIVAGISGDALPAEVEAMLKTEHHLPTQEPAADIPLIESNQRIVAFTPLFDGAGQAIGNLILTKDAHPAYQEKYRFLLLASLAGGLIVLLLFILFYVITGRVEREIRELNRRNRLILEAADEGIVGLDRNGFINFINPAGARMLGYTPEELIGRQHHQVMHHTQSDGSPDAEEVSPVFKTLRDSSTQKVQCDIRWRKDGSHFPVDLISSPIIDEDKLIGAVITFSNISERLAQQQRIHEGDLRMRAIVDNAYDGIITIEKTGRILSFNPAAVRLFGYTAQEIIGSNVKMLIKKPQRMRHEDYIARYLAAFEAKKVDNNQEVTALRKDGSNFPARLSVSMIELNGEHIFMGMIQDITMQKRAEQAIRDHAIALERSNQELQNFAYVASHDLQEPLRKIMAFGDRLASHHGDVFDEKGLDYLARMRNAAERMRLLISSLLAYSRVESKARPFETVNLDTVLAEVLSDLENSIQDTGGQISVDELPTVQADPVQMHQLLQNLIGNGLKFRRRDAPPRVQVRCKVVANDDQEALPNIAVEHTCVISVSDNGIGFDNKYIDRIFNIFQRLHSHDEYEGSGIGLAICRKIAERHNGMLTGEGRVGDGATFTLKIPVRQPNNPINNKAIS